MGTRHTAAAKRPILGSALVIFSSEAAVVTITSQASGAAVIQAYFRRPDFTRIAVATDSAIAASN